MSDGYAGYRTRLVETLRSKGIRDLAVLRAVATVPRHLFVPDYLAHRAYDDSALPIGSNQTISQPWIQARTLEAMQLSGRETVLEIGTGSGYQTALLALLAETVVSIVRVGALSDAARASLERAGIRGPILLVSDGTLGWQPLAPYDAIAVSAASPDVPEPLVRQLVPGGRLVIPIGDRDHQVLTLVRRTQDGVELTSLADARFVPLIGEHGWDGH